MKSLKFSCYDTLHNMKQDFETFLTGNNISVAILLLVLLRLTDQTVVQRLEILEILPRRETDAYKTYNEFKLIPSEKFSVDSYFKLLQWYFLLQEPPHHADHSVQLRSCVLAIRDHFDEGQRGQLILCDDWSI